MTENSGRRSLLETEPIPSSLSSSRLPRRNLVGIFLSKRDDIHREVFIRQQEKLMQENTEKSEEAKPHKNC